MTDREKAEEYVMNHECITRDCNQYPNCDSCNNQHMLQAYLDGIAEGRKEKWHDLRKNPDDLPKYKNSSVNRICWINEYGNKCYHNAFYDDKGFYWVSEKTCTKCYPVIKIIAWCELPEFKE